MATLSQDGRKAVGRLKKPVDMRPSTWKQVQALLRELCRYLPNVHPGQRALAESLKTSLSATQRLVARAEAEGFIERTEHPVKGKPRPGTSYRLTFLQSQLQSQFGSEIGTEEDRRSSTTSPTLRVVGFAPAAPGANSSRRRDSRAFHSRQPNRYDGYCHVCTHPVGKFHGFLHGPHPVHRECDSGTPDWPRLKEYLMRERYGDPNDWGTALGADPDEPLPTHTPPPAKSQVRLAKHFEQHWNESMFKRKEWRGTYRGIDLGPAIGYIKTKMLDAGFNEEHIALMMDEFFLDLLDPTGDLMMREGQTCWQLFTGWWGRHPVEDPVPARKKREKIDRLSKAVADHIATITKPERPPVRRRVLTQRQPPGYGDESQVSPPDGDYR